jgi:hypothetical protein
MERNMIYELGELIGTRELRLERNDGTKERILIKLGKPRAFPDSSDWYVPFQITGIGSETVLCAGGIDVFQALQQAMPIIGAQIAALNEHAQDS